MSDVTTAPTPKARPPAAKVSDAPSNASAVSWAAILAGAAGAAALSLILVILGSGLGFTAVSPWSLEGLSAATLGLSAVLWLSLTQIAASGMGGYLAGRLRTKWTLVHTDEVYFRDTAHGFLTWATATLLTAALLTTAIGSVVSGAANAGGQVMGATMGAASGVAANSVDSDEGLNNTLEYYVDTMFRNERPSSDRRNEQRAEIPSAEVVRIAMKSLGNDNLAQDDQRYIAQLVARHTDLSQSAAEQRVESAFSELQGAIEDANTNVREAADTARKTTAYAALWMFITLLMGAFTASLAAVYGGRQRDA